VRAGLAATGILLLVIGAVLWYLPLQTIQSGSQSVPTNYGLITQPVAPYAYITPSISFSTSWQGSAAVTVKVFDCGTDSKCGGVDPTTSNPVASGNGTSGTISWTGKGANYYEVFPSSGTSMSYQATVPLLKGIVGLALLALGVVLLLVGLVAGRRKPAPAPATAAPA
jgi:hypothetical protein